MAWPFRGRDEALARALRSLRASSRRGVVVAGSAYVGRTRFLDELLSRLDDEVPRHRLTATRSSRATPFAVLGRLAPRHPDQPHTWRADVLDALGGRGALLVIDDAQWLDDATAQLLLDLATAGDATVVAALRRGHRAPHALTTLWKDEVLLRVDLGPLDRAGSDEVIEAALGGPVSSALLQELWDLCRGYPMLLRHYVEGGRRTGALEREDGLWVVSGTLTAPPSLVDEVRAQLEGFGPEMSEAIHLIALGEPLEADVLDQLVPADVIGALERSDAVEHDPRTGRYRLSAPGACRALRAALEPSVMRSLSRRLSSAMIDEGLHDDDLVRLAIWRLDAGDTTDNSLLVRAAERAASTFDHGLTERLARAALEGGGPESRLLLANALIHQRRNEEAERHLADAAGMVEDDVYRARVAGLWSRLLFFRLGRTDDGIGVLERACEEVADPDVVDQLRGSLALLESMVGHLDEAIHLCDLVLERPAATAAAKTVASMSAAISLVMRGDLERGLALCETALDLPAAVTERDYPLARPMLRFIAMLAEAYLGDFDAAERRARERYRQALERGIDEVSGVWATQLASLMLYRGDLEESLRYSAEGRRLLSVSDTLGVHTLAFAHGAIALAETGRVQEAEQMLEGLVEVRALRDVRSELLESRARAAVQAAAGELESAAELIRESTATALSYGHRVWAQVTAHQAVRIGYPEQVVATMADLGASMPGVLMPLLAAHAEALADGDAAALETVGRRFVDVGANLWAAETYAQASRSAADGGALQRASLLRATAASLLRRCPGAATPALRGLQVAPLTRREHEIALLAARGLTSREIAGRLVVSPRTVDNHLANVYRKLDITGRDQLADALAVGR